LILVGITAGILYGWVVNPIPFTSLEPHSLRIDYRTDFVLMVAELYHYDPDLAQAAERLIYLGETSLNALMDEAITYAEENDYAPGDIAYMNDLALAIDLALTGAE